MHSYSVSVLSACVHPLHSYGRNSETLLSLSVSGELHYGNLHSVIALSVQETFQALDMRLCATIELT